MDDTRERLRTLRWLGPMMFGCWIFWGFGYETVWQRLATAVDGTVTSSRDLPATGAPRYATEYVILGSDGHTQAYIAGPTDADLQRSLPVGTHIRKKRGELGYDVDGRWISFPLAFYGVTLTIATGLFGLGACRLLSRWWRTADQ